MKIEKIYIGGWFQRTMLHLTEIYDFLRGEKSHLDLNEKKLKELRDNLEIKSIEYGVNGFECVKIDTVNDLEIKIYEDGLIVLNSGNTSGESVFTDIKEIATYYETKFSPAISYIFSLGAPIPKELAGIKTIYPYFIVFNNEASENISKLLSETDRKKYFEFKNKDVDILRGDEYYFINNKTGKLPQIERYIEEQIFFREFKGQLHRYLNLHRIIWEKIADVKEKPRVKGKDILEFSSKIDEYAKTINLVDSRINQMNTYLRTREKISKNDEALKHFTDIMEYRYETLGDTLAYIQQIWVMTKNYVNSAKSLFSDLQSEITSKSVENLTIVTSMGVGASLIGLFTDSMPTFSIYGIMYFGILAIIGYTTNKIMKKISENRKYEIGDKDYSNIK